MTTHIKELLDALLKDKAKDSQINSNIHEIVKNVLGKYLSEHLNLEKIQKTILIFKSDSPSFRFEQELKKQQLLEEIKKELPHIEDIEIRI
jgi:hypothetical protein